MNTAPAGATGPDFVSFQVRDLAASADFYERVVGLTRRPVPNPQAVVFSTGVAGTTAFAVRVPFPGVDLDAAGQLGAGVGVWFHHPEAAALHARLADAGVPAGAINLVIHDSSEPPGMIEGPVSAPSSPPEMPAPTKLMPVSLTAFSRRIVSVNSALPPSTMMSPGSKTSVSALMTASVPAPALTMMIAVRGLASVAANSSYEKVPTNSASGWAASSSSATSSAGPRA